MFCPGSGITHRQKYVRIMQGPRTLFIDCEVRNCGAKMFLRGPGWEGYGVTREEALRRNPEAMEGL